MRNLRKRLRDRELEEIGGEPLEGSGFENEMPDPSFEPQRSAKEEERRDDK